MSDGQLCDCPELASYATPPAFYQFHNCAYVKARGALVPTAAKAASEEISGGKFGSGNERRTAWNHAYTRAMERLALERQTTNESAPKNETS